MPSQPQVSFEVMAPRATKGLPYLRAMLTIRLIENLLAGSKFASVTFRMPKPGEPKNASFNATMRLAKFLQPGQTVVPHLTCSWTRKAETLTMATAYWQAGFTRILALTCDRPARPPALPPGSQFRYASELLTALQTTGRAYSELLVAAHPQDLAHLPFLKEKYQAGASRAITQVCFDNAGYAEFVAAAADRAIAPASLIRGLLPLHTELAKIENFLKICGVDFPTAVKTKFAQAATPMEYEKLATQFLEQQICQLAGLGGRAVHIYTANKFEAALIAYHALGGEPNPDTERLTQINQRLNAHRPQL